MLPQDKGVTGVSTPRPLSTALHDQIRSRHLSEYPRTADLGSCIKKQNREPETTTTDTKFEINVAYAIFTSIMRE